MTNRRKHFDIDFADLEVELRKSIKRDQFTNKLGTYVIKITNSLLYQGRIVRVYEKEQIDLMRFEIYDYILRKLLVNYDPDRKSGFAFIKKMAMNRLRTTVRSIHARGIRPDEQVKVYNRFTKSHDIYKFLSINTYFEE